MSEEMKSSTIDYSQFFMPAAGSEKAKTFEKKEEDPTRTGQVLDVMNSHRLGTTLFCLIPDNVLIDVNGVKIPRLYRKVLKGYTGRVKNKEDKYIFFQVPSEEDFSTAGLTLTIDQSTLLKEVRDLLHNLSPFVAFKSRNLYPSINEKLKISYAQQLVFTYGKLIKFIDKTNGQVNNEEMGHVRVFKFSKGEIGKTDFITTLNGAIQNKSAALASTAWMKDFFSRTEGQRAKAISVRVDRPETTGIQKYSMNISLEEIAPFTITKEDLEIADNLNSRVYNVTSFDTNHYIELKTALQAIQQEVNSLANKEANV